MSRTVSFESQQGAKAAAVKTQVQQDCVDESLIGLLESYLDEQIATNVVDEAANVMLLKLYTLYPSAAQQQPTRAAQILAKGLMTLPSTFYLGASYLISESVRKVGPSGESCFDLPRSRTRMLRTCSSPDNCCKPAALPNFGSWICLLPRKLQDSKPRFMNTLSRRWPRATTSCPRRLRRNN